MQDPDLWTYALQAAVFALALTLAMRGILAAAAKPLPAGHAGRLMYSSAVLAVGSLCFILFAGAVILERAYKQPTGDWWLSVVFVGFAVLGLYVAAAYFREHHEFSDEGLLAGHVLSASSYIRWDTVRSVRFSWAMQWFVIEGRADNVARVSLQLRGLPMFASAVLAHVPRAAIEPGALNRLRDLANRPLQAK